MRPLILLLCALLSVLWMGLLVGCTEKDDTGKACGESLALQPASPVPGETTVNEVVILQRDTQCLALHCLEHQGLPAYCTKECSEDDCAPGFWCQQVQSVGPLREQSFCVRRTDCRNNSDCGELGAVDCVQHGCLDECLLNPDCASHQLICLPQPELPCHCKEGTADLTGGCADKELLCQTDTDQGYWPASSVAQRGICTPGEEE